MKLFGSRTVAWETTILVLKVFTPHKVFQLKYMYFSLSSVVQHVFLKVKLSPAPTMKHMGRGSDIRLHSFLTSAPDGGDWYTSHPSHFISKMVWKLQRRETLFVLPEFEPRIIQPAACSSYWLRYLSYFTCAQTIIFSAIALRKDKLRLSSLCIFCTHLFQPLSWIHILS